MTFYGAKHGTVVKGPTLLHVGERSPDDKEFAQDEFVLAPPGTVVAPRPHDMEPTPENAARAIMAQLSEASLVEAQEGATVSKGKACKILEDGMVNGKKLTGPQKRLFGMACSGKEPELAGAQEGATVAPGAQSMADFLQQLLGQGGVSIDMLLGIIGLMQSLGTIIPGAIGITDPADLRDIIGGATGGNVPTLDARQFGEQQRVNNANIMAQLGFIIPGLLGQTDPRRFDAGLAMALDPGLSGAVGDFGAGGGNITDIGRAARNVGPIPTLAQKQQEYQQALTGFRSFGLGRPRPRTSPTASI
jgi:hypothetical protein